MTGRALVRRVVRVIRDDWRTIDDPLFMGVQSALFLGVAGFLIVEGEYRFALLFAVPLGALFAYRAIRAFRHRRR